MIKTDFDGLKLVFIKLSFCFAFKSEFKLPMKKDASYDYLAKLLIIGDSGVGKTNILLRFC
jgi:hypothetical protein